MRPGKIVTRSAVVCGLLVLTPITFTSEGGIQDNLACSAGKKIDCVREIDSVCTAGDEPVLNYYTKSAN
ncbi:MAG: hypothetical protein Q8W46_03155 [Candidatus Palauibacterales bacterium]|jgi:hypothetical protein|nr:hypothetical protein [Candidatus Palauibacterales bacterium]